MPQFGSVSARPPRDLTAGEPRQEPFPLLVGAEAFHGRRHDQVRVEDAGERHPHFGDARDDLGVGSGREPESPVFTGYRGAEQAELLHLLDHLAGVCVGVLERHDPVLDVPVEPLVDGIEDLCLVLGGNVRVGRASRRVGHIVPPCPDLASAAAITSSTA